MTDYKGRSPFMDYRNSVPFIDLSGYIVKQPSVLDGMPAKSIQENLLRKKFSTMINLRRLQYKFRVEELKNGRR